MDERAIMKKKMFKDEQKLKSLQQIIVKDLNRKLAKKVSLHLLKKFNEPPQKEEIKILKDMLMSTNKQTKILTSENHRLKKKFERFENKVSRRKNNQINCSRELRNQEMMDRKRSHRNLLGDLEGPKLQYGTQESIEDQTSPRFIKPASQIREKVTLSFI